MTAAMTGATDAMTAKTIGVTGVMTAGPGVAVPGCCGASSTRGRATAESNAFS